MLYEVHTCRLRSTSVVCDGGQPPNCRRVSFGAPALMRHKKRGAVAPTALGRRRCGRAWTEIRRAWSLMLSQGRDRAHQSCVVVPSASPLGVSSIWVSTTSWLNFNGQEALGLFSVEPLLNDLSKPQLQPKELGVRNAVPGRH